MNQLLSQIIEHPLSDDQFFKDKYTKRQIVLHHTVSNGNAENGSNGQNSACLFLMIWCMNFNCFYFSAIKQNGLKLCWRAT